MQLQQFHEAMESIGFAGRVWWVSFAPLPQGLTYSAHSESLILVFFGVTSER